MDAAAEEEAEDRGILQAAEEEFAAAFYRMDPDITSLLAVAAGHSEPAEGGSVAPGSDRGHLPAAASGPFAPSPGLRVRIQNLQRQVDYNGLLGTVEREVGAGFFCVRLEDGSARRLRVRASNLLDASDSLTSSASPVATTAASSSVGASGPNHIHIDLQGAAMAGTGEWHAALPGSGGNLRVDIRPQHQNLSRDHASVSSLLRQYAVAPRPPRHGVPPSPPSYGDASAAMLRAFNRMDLGSKFGLYFETGCTRLVYEALLQRNVQFALEPPEMRETLLRLSICLEGELVAARESVEAGAFGLAAAGAQAPDTPASSPVTVPANLEVLGRLDLATQEQRVTLWAVEVVKYGMPLETPLRQFHRAPRTVLQTPGSPEQQAVGLLVALGQHQHAASEGGEGSRVAGGAEGTAAPGVLDVLHLWLDTNASGIPGAIPDARGASGSPHHQETAARPSLEEGGHRLPSGQPPSPADVMRQGQTPEHSESQSDRGPGSTDQPEHAGEGAGGGERSAAPAHTQRLLTALTPAELQAAGAILSQLERGQPPPSGEGSDCRLIHRLAQALSHQMFSAAFSGNLRVMEAVFSLPPRLLCATGIEAGMQQAGSLLQPLHMASYNGHATIVRFLLGRPGVSVNVPAGDHDTPLHKACFNAHSQVVLLLLEAGADPNATTPFSLERRTCAHGHHKKERRNGRRTPLHYTVFNHELPPSPGRTESVRILLGKGADPNAKDCWGLAALHHAAYGGFVEIARLLHHDASTLLNLQCGDDGCGDTPLMKASWKGHAAIVKILLSDRPSHGIEDLDSPGADCNISNRDGATALHFAADQGYLEIIEMLLNAGAVPAADKKNLQPQDVAASKGHSAIVELLQSTRGSHGQSTGDSSR